MKSAMTQVALAGIDRHQSRLPNFPARWPGMLAAVAMLLMVFQVPASSAALTQGTKTLLYMPVAFSDAPAEPISQSGARNLMNQVGQFFAEESYNTLSIVTEVTPLLILPQTKAYYQIQGHDALAAAARGAAHTAGFDASNYDLEIVHHQSLGAPNFSYLATASIGGRGLDLQTSALSVVEHELGHNLGLYHANFWTAAGDSVIGPGSVGEYGNIFDLMGADSSSPSIHEFGAENKHALDWLPLSSVHTVTSSGTYRIFAFDVPNLVGGQQYALRVQKDYARWYWAEYRQKFTGNPWTQNGVVLNWSPWNNTVGNSLRGTVMLDTTPGTPVGNNGRDDAPVVIGRTFSDPAAGIHLTPLAKGTDSSGNWLDLRVNLGSFPGNLPPVLQLAADQTSVPVDAEVNFSATASDADGDSLAYDWDFGDLTFGSNSPIATKSWSGSGEYVVRCAVSDMKGGVASRNLVITVGTPDTFQVSGRITTAGGQPVAGVRVHNGLGGTAYRGAYTDSDGYYVVANLAAGSHTLSAIKYGYALATAGWNNPVIVGPGLANQDWTATQGPVLSVAASDPEAAEAGADPGRFTLSRTGSLASALTVRFNLSGSATYSSDYALAPAPAAGPPLQLVMPAGVSSIDIGLTALADPTAEGPETVTLTLFENSAYVLGSLAEATVTIADSQTPGTPTVIVSAPDNLATETGLDTGVFQFTRTGGVAGDLSVHYAVGGTAGNGVDCSPLSGVAVIPAGQASTVVSFTTVDDAVVEGNESVTAAILSNAAYHVGTPSSATVTIVDNDPPTVMIAATDDTAVEGSSNSGTWTIARVGSLAADLVVHYTLTGTAANGVDYVALPGTVTIPAGLISASVTVSPLNDSIVEGTETVVATLASDPGYNIGNPGSASVVMTDDDSPRITLAASDASASEAGLNPGTFTFTRTGNAAEPLTVYFNVSGSAVNGVDYLAIGNSVVIPAGSASVPLTVTPVDDAIKENNETVILSLAPSPTDYYSLSTTTSKTVTLADNDSSGPVGVGFASATSSGPESEFFVKLNVSLSAASTSPVTIYYAFGVGTAGNPSDFVFATPQPISFSPGQVAKNVTLFQTIDDTLVEVGETVLITVSNPVNAVLDAFTTHTHTILDNDSGGTVSVAATDANASESGPDPGIFRISRSGPATGDLTANFQVVGTASSPSDFLPLGNSVVIPAGQNHVDLVVTPVDDTTPEAAETVTLTLTSAPGASIGTSGSATIMLDPDNDNLPDNLPGTLAVAQATGLISVGPGGGPFSPAAGTYTLSNIADTPLDWEASTDAPWIDLSASSGTLAPGASVEVVVTLNSQAKTLLPQTYSATVAFTNTTNTNGNANWEVNLTVLPPPQVPNQISLTNDDDVVLRFWGIPGTAYQIERSLDLKTWTPLASQTAAANGFIEFTDSSPPEWRGFYRIAPP